MSYEIEKTLVLSTNHVSPKLRDVLEDSNNLPGLVFDGYEHGWRIYVPTEGQNDERLSFESLRCGSDEDFETIAPLLPALQLACSLGCKWLRLDEDADTLDELPSWEW